YAQIAAAFSEGRYLEVLSKVEALDASEDALDLRDRYVFRARLARVDTLVASGRAYEALAALDAMDAAYGAGWSTLRRRAQLGLFTADLEGALAAVERALLHMPAKKGWSPYLAEAALMKVDLLVAAQRFDEAREF